MKILFAADLSFHTIPEFPGKEQAKFTFEETAKLFHAADFSVVNQENVFGKRAAYTPIIKTGPNLISEDAFIAYLDKLSPTVIGLANNHTGDFGEEAVFHTLSLLQAHGYQTIGAGKNIEEAYRPAILEKDGVAAQIIAVCENEFGVADATHAGSAGYDLTRVTHAIQAAVRNGHIPIIYFHGGNEYNPFPSPGKVALYRHFVELGAKAVIAMHTHCPQGYEIYQDCPIVYSMGNFFFPPFDYEKMCSWCYGYMAELMLDQKNCSIRIIPYTFDSKEHRLLCGEEKEAFLRYIQALSEVIKDPVLLQEYFDCWCLHFGFEYVTHLQFVPNVQNGDPRMTAVMRNALHCEAHNELVTRAMELLYRGITEGPKDLVDRIKRLQNMEL